MKKLLRELLKCADWQISEVLLDSGEIIYIHWVDEKKAKKLIREYSRKKEKK